MQAAVRGELWVRSPLTVYKNLQVASYEAVGIGLVDDFNEEAKVSVITAGGHGSGLRDEAFLARKATIPATRVAAKKNGLGQKKLPANVFIGIPQISAEIVSASVGSNARAHRDALVLQQRRPENCLKHRN